MYVIMIYMYAPTSSRRGEFFICGVVMKISARDGVDEMSPPLIRSDSVSLVTVLCKDIGQALTFYVGQLGFKLKCDEMIGQERFVVAAPCNLVEFAPQTNLRFHQAVTPDELQVCGMQAGRGNCFLTLETDCWDTLVEKLTSMGVVGPVRENEEERLRAVTVADPMGNLINIVDKPTKLVGRVFAKDIGY